MAWRFHEHILRGELDNTVRGRVTGRIWLAGIAEPMTLDLRGDCAPDLAGCTLAFENPTPVPFTDSPPSLDQRGWVGDITASQTLKVFDLPVDEALALIHSGKDASWHWAKALYLEWHSTTNGGITIQTAEFQITVSVPAWTFAPGEYEAGREASGREFIEWSKAEFGWTDEALQASENADDGFDENEGEEWKHADDDVTRTILSAESPAIARSVPDAAEPDPMLIFDPLEDAGWMPAFSMPMPNAPVATMISHAPQRHLLRDAREAQIFGAKVVTHSEMQCASSIANSEIFTRRIRSKNASPASRSGATQSSFHFPARKSACTRCVSSAVRLESSRRDPARPQRIDLVFHQRDERRNHERRPLAQHRRELMAERLPSARGEKRERGWRPPARRERSRGRSESGEISTSP